jgi:predicted DNA-binding transcriptional regulator AlpA
MSRKLKRSQVAERYGNVATRTIDRWTADAKLGFPQPLYIGSTPMWDEAELSEWERTRAKPGRPRKEASQTQGSVDDVSR